MGKLTPYFTTERSKDLTVENLLEIIDAMYVNLADAINNKPDIYCRDVDGQSDDTFLSIGSVNVNETTNKVEILTEHVDSSTVIWTQIS